MNKRELLHLAYYNKNGITQVIRNDYSKYIQNELYRIVGYADDFIIENIISDVVETVSEVWDDGDISFLVFDCIRKKIISICKANDRTISRTNIDILRKSEFPEKHHKLDDLRVDVVLLFLNNKQRKYFLDRYYYFRNDVKINKRYERIISKLFNGKGIATLRFRHFNIPYKKVTSDLYADYLNRLDYSYFGQLNTDKSTIISRNISCVPNMITIVEREYNIIKVSVPICLFLLLILVLFYFCILF